MWKESLAVISATIIAAAILYPVYTQVVSTADQPATPDTGLTNSTAYSNSTLSSSLTNSSSEEPSTSTTKETSTSQAQFGPDWVSQFFSIVNVDRGGSALSPCANLDSFAALRFQTMNGGSNWEIIHSGYSEDLRHTYGGTAGNYAEEYFYPDTPSYRSPTGFVGVVQTTAPGHWSDLTNPLYRFYGVHTGTGPVLLFPHGCTPSEFTAGVNQTHVPSGCSYQKVPGSWLVVELSDSCV